MKSALKFSTTLAAALFSISAFAVPGPGHRCDAILAGAQGCPSPEGSGSHFGTQLNLHLELNKENSDSLSASEIYQRTQAVLAMYPTQLHDPEPSVPMKDLTAPIDSSTYLKYLPFIDPTGQFERHFTVNEKSVDGFADRDAKKVREYSISASNRAEIQVYGPKNPDQDHPLKGLRIAIDPGHMGTHQWDIETGKYVHDEDGNVLSEGVLNLQTSLLLKEQFEALGATVMLTHDQLATVSESTPQQIDLHQYGNREVAVRSYESWFQDLLHGDSIDDVKEEFKSSAKVQFLHSEQMRMEYYIHSEDLDARARKILAFKPQLTLIVHFDAPDAPGSDPNRIMSATPNFTRTYVPGSFLSNEYSTIGQREGMIGLLLRPKRFQASIDLSQSIANTISSRLKVPFMPEDDGSTPVVPGVLARNLRVSRLVDQGLISYLECLMYGNEEEFNRLNAKDFSMEIGGKSYPYSKRLVELSTAIRDGVVSFYAKNSMKKSKRKPRRNPRPVQD